MPEEIYIEKVCNRDKEEEPTAKGIWNIVEWYNIVG